MIINPAGLGEKIAAMTALQLLETLGYKPDTPKVKRAAEYFEMWRTESVKEAKK